MHQTFNLTGSIVDNQTIQLDEKLPMSLGKVRVLIEEIIPEKPATYRQVMEEIRANLIAHGHVPRTREEVVAYLDNERESWSE